MHVGFPRSFDGPVGHIKVPLCEKLKSHIYISYVIDFRNGVSHLKTDCKAAAMTENAG